MVILVAALSALPVLPAPLSAPVSAPLTPFAPAQQPQESWEEIRAKISLEELHPLSPAERAFTARIQSEALPGLPALSSVGLLELVEALAEATGIRMSVTDQALDIAADEDFTFTANWTQPSSLPWCLDLICRDLAWGVSWAVEGEEVVIYAREERVARQIFHLHPVKDLLPFVEIENLATTVRDYCFPHLWEHDGCSLDPSGQFLAAANSRRVQLAIERQMNDIRAFYDSRAEAPRFELPAALRADLDEITRLEKVPVTTSLPSDEGTAAEWLEELGNAAELNIHITQHARHELDLDEQVSLGPLEGIHQMPLGQVLRSLRQRLDAHVSILPGWIILHTEGESFELRAQMSFDVWDIVAPLGEPDDAVIESAMLEEYVHVLVDSDSWDTNPANSIRVTEDGVLSISQSARALDETCTLLRRIQKVAVTTRGRHPRQKAVGR